jgi:hypothetical protein
MTDTMVTCAAVDSTAFRIDVYFKHKDIVRAHRLRLTTTTDQVSDAWLDGLPPTLKVKHEDEDEDEVR